MKNLKVTVIQPDIIWENANANLEKYTKWIETIEETDLIILPEMFTTGFSMEPKNLKETMDGTSVNWMKIIAAKNNAAVLGSLIIEEDNKIVNRALWVFPNGEIRKYDKRHLFTMGEENLNYHPGKEKLIVEYKGWKFCPLICYDLRFPVWARNTDDYDVLIYVANWPSPRHHVWKNLLVSRAIENQSYCIGVNRIGKDGNSLKYSGDSVLVSPKGLGLFIDEGEQIKTFELSYSDLHSFREKFPLLNDRDNFELLT